ncbi:dirigent protein 22-like protein [Tanacetum coccineum]
MAISRRVGFGSRGELVIDHGNEPKGRGRSRVSGNSPTALRVAQSNITSTSPTAFGFIAMVDDKLTSGPEPNSTIVGQAQGIYGSACLDEAGLLMTMNLVFNGAEYSGSTLSLLGRNAPFHPYREMPIVGGSGVFRMG